jgi:S-adenosyl methyltransferase
VRFLAGAGIRQFLDIGSGIPTEGNVHEVAQRADPACRTAYVELDPVAVARSQAILGGNPSASVIEADLREPEVILAHDEVRRLIDLGQPVGLLLVAVPDGRTRSREEIQRFFDDLDLVDPGLTYVPQWRPDSPADVPDDPSTFWFLVGVAGKS